MSFKQDFIELVFVIWKSLIDIYNDACILKYCKSSYYYVSFNDNLTYGYIAFMI